MDVNGAEFLLACMVGTQAAGIAVCRLLHGPGENEAGDDIPNAAFAGISWTDRRTFETASNHAISPHHGPHHWRRIN